MVASANPILAEKGQRDPTLVCTGYKRSRFYMFTRTEPEHKSGDRDIFNERPTREEQSIATSTTGAKSGPSPVANSATIHTTMGDIHLRLFPQQAPKAVENFVGHARSGYFENLIFHRVIPKFMIQTGDPLGDGTGGTSIWGDEFEDEFSDDLKHDRCVSFLVCIRVRVDSVPGRILSVWQMLGRIPMGRNSSSRPTQLHGWTENIPSLAAFSPAWRSCTTSKTSRRTRWTSLSRISRLSTSMSNNQNILYNIIFLLQRFICSKHHLIHDTLFMPDRYADMLADGVVESVETRVEHDLQVGYYRCRSCGVIDRNKCSKIGRG